MCYRRTSNWTPHLGGEHEKAFDAGVFGVGRTREVVSSQTGAVEHVRDAVTPQQFQTVGVALTADVHVLQQLGRMQQRRRVGAARAVGDARRLLEDLLHPLKVELVVGEHGRLDGGRSWHDVVTGSRGCHGRPYNHFTLQLHDRIMDMVHGRRVPPFTRQRLVLAHETGPLRIPGWYFYGFLSFYYYIYLY